MTEELSERIIDQRLHNRYMEELYCRVDWEESIKGGSSEYFCRFYDFLDDRFDAREKQCLEPEEIIALSEVRSLMNTASKGFLCHATKEKLSASGWPQRIEPIARKALELMMLRGWFHEEREEKHPSLKAPWQEARNIGS